MTPKEHFILSYIGTALWSSTGAPPDADDSDSDIPLDDWEGDLSDETRAALEKTAGDFYDANSEHIHCEDAPLAHDTEGSIAAREAAMAGHDLWLNSNGHGAGFWDGDWPEPAASILDTAARKARSYDLYIGDDGEIYA